MAINSYDDTKITKGGIWVTITKASCIMSFKPRHVHARLNTIFVAVAISCIVYALDVCSRIPARKYVFLVQEVPYSAYNTWSFPGLGHEINSLDTSNSSKT